MPNREIINGKRARRQGGSAMVEICLLAPWIFFLFVGVMDAGFFSYAAICTQNAARAAAIATAGIGNQTLKVACTAAQGEMTLLPNITVNYAGTCIAAPLTVAQQTLTTTCPDYDATHNSTVSCSFVAVTYTSVQLIPIPGVFTGCSGAAGGCKPGVMTLTRNATARIWQ